VLVKSQQTSNARKEIWDKYRRNLYDTSSSPKSKLTRIVPGYTNTVRSIFVEETPANVEPLRPRWPSARKYLFTAFGYSTTGSSPCTGKSGKSCRALRDSFTIRSNTWPRNSTWLKATSNRAHKEASEACQHVRGRVNIKLITDFLARVS
jgi:hypothetical protein